MEVMPYQKILFDRFVKEGQRLVFGSSGHFMGCSNNCLRRLFSYYAVVFFKHAPILFITSSTDSLMISHYQFTVILFFNVFIFNSFFLCLNMIFHDYSLFSKEIL